MFLGKIWLANIMLSRHYNTFLNVWDHIYLLVCVYLADLIFRRCFFENRFQKNSIISFFVIMKSVKFFILTKNPKSILKIQKLFEIYINSSSKNILVGNSTKFFLLKIGNLILWFLWNFYNNICKINLFIIILISFGTNASKSVF